MTSSKIDIKNTTKGRLPSLPFEKIKNKVLGKKYELSLVFIGNKLSRKLNNKYRNLDKPTNILSFPLSESDGEIFINLNLVPKEAPKFNKTPTKFIAYLFIHGVIHLKGFEHSSKMEAKENKILDFFNL